MGEFLNETKKKKSERRRTVCAWTKEERRWLYHCYEWSGGINRGGYIEKVDNLYHCKEFTYRSRPALVAQLKHICNGGLTEMERSEIRESVMREKIELFGVDSCILETSFDETFEGLPEELEGEESVDRV